MGARPTSSFSVLCLRDQPHEIAHLPAFTSELFDETLLRKQTDPGSLDLWCPAQHLPRDACSRILDEWLNEVPSCEQQFANEE